MSDQTKAILITTIHLRMNVILTSRTSVTSMPDSLKFARSADQRQSELSMITRNARIGGV